ncbi:hypothetical protein GCM10017691_27410 [Pseudonocardia petroleophila]
MPSATRSCRWAARCARWAATTGWGPHPDRDAVIVAGAASSGPPLAGRPVRPERTTISAVAGRRQGRKSRLPGANGRGPVHPCGTTIRPIRV